MSNWITAITFTLPHEAYIAQNVLESEGIETIIKDELTIQVNNFYSNAIGGVKLQVEERYLNESIRILENAGFIKDKATNNEYFEIEIIELNSQTDINKCQYCSSENIGKSKDTSILMIIVYFILGAFLPFYKENYLCFDCNKRWRFKK